MNLAEKMAEYAIEFDFHDIDEPANEALKLRLVDSIACSLAAYRERSIETLIDQLSARPGDEARSLTGEAMSVENAAFANGSLIRFVDWNDTYHGKSNAHPSDNFGIVFAVGDLVEATGEEVMEASVLAYEIQSRLASSVDPRKRGLDHVTHGVISSTIAAGKLLGLSGDELVEAINMALAGHIPLRQFRAGQVSDFKGMAFGNASRNAAFVALLAQAGIDGPKPIFEGKYGLNNLLHEGVDIRIDEFGGNDGSFLVDKSIIKLYPVYGHGQPVVECARSIYNDDAFDPDDIVRIECETYQQLLDYLDEEKWQPQTRGTADHSVPFCIAQTLLEGELPVERFRQEILTDEIAALIEKITLVENETFTEYRALEEYDHPIPHKMRVVTSDGEFEAEVKYPRGHPKNPLSMSEIEEKFRSQSMGLIPGHQADQLLEWISNLENQLSVGGLFNYLSSVK